MIPPVARLLLLTLLLPILPAQANPVWPQVIGDNDLTQLHQTNRWPISPVVRLRDYYDHKTNSCSGVMVASNAVLTAAHCLYDKEAQAFANKVSVYPAKNGSLNVYSSHEAHHYIISPGYVEAPWWEAREYDWALVILKEHVGDQTGWYEVAALDDDALSGRVLHMIGYPNGDCDDCPWTGKNLHLGSGPSGYVAPRFLLHAIDSMSGSSGSGVFVRVRGRPIVVAVHSTSGDDTEILNQAARITPDVLDLIAAEVGRFGGRMASSGAPQDNLCCRPGDPCGLRTNGQCDCADGTDWDHADCGTEVSTPYCKPCAEDADCGEPWYCSNYSDYPEFSFCVHKCADLACPEYHYCTDLDTCWVTGRNDCHYGHVWRRDQCDNFYKLVDVCHQDEVCFAGACLPLQATCLLDSEEPDDALPTPPQLVDSAIRSLCPSDDVDRVRIVAPAGAQWRVETWGAWGDTVLQARTSAGELLAMDDDGGQDRFAALQVTVPPTGAFDVEVSAGTFGYVPRYVLSEYPVICTPDCSDRACGDDGCGGSCGSCGDGTACIWGRCVCAANCDQQECGTNPCGGDCGGCSHLLATCVNGTCQCTPDCDGKSCGGDGCGGSCGSCQAGAVCQDGECVCVPQCDGLTCGPDGCGGSCGTCDPLSDCVDGHCACERDCAGRTCGPDGCGGSCGSCNTPLHECLDGECVCLPECDDRTCGPDGCGGSCGECGGGELCHLGHCVDAGAGCAAVCPPGSCGIVADCYCGDCPPAGAAQPDVVASPEQPASTSSGCTASSSVPAAPSLLVLLLLLVALFSMRRPLQSPSRYA